MKYRKKPVEIEAFRYDGDFIDKDGNYYIPGWGIEAFENNIIKYNSYDNGKLAIETLEGTMFADIGDYIIKGVNGELYPCKPDIFRKTYELVTPCEINISNEIIKKESNLDGLVERVKENISNSLRKKSTLVTEMDYIERMEQEYIELTGRSEKLYEGIKTLEGLTADELGLMYAQYYVMKIYEEALSNRISLAKELAKGKQK